MLLVLWCWPRLSWLCKGMASPRPARTSPSRACVSRPWTSTATAESPATSGRAPTVHSGITTGTATASCPATRSAPARSASTELGNGRSQAEPLRAQLSWTAAGFTNLDHNRDGRLTANEWHYDLETFRRVDRNRDNAISLRGVPRRKRDDDRDDSFDDLDANNNGRVERAEWYGGVNEFTRLDRNRDGVLSRFEVVGSQPSFDTYDQFANLDYDRNGTPRRATSGTGRTRSFTQRDTNRDGVLSRREFEASGGAPARDAPAAGHAGRSASMRSSAGPTPVIDRARRRRRSRSRRAARSR